METGLGLPSGASAPTPLPTLHLSAFQVRGAQPEVLGALSVQGHAKLAVLVQALGPRAGLAAAEAAPLDRAQARRTLAAFDAALDGIPAASLKDPAGARAAADALWESVQRRSAPAFVAGNATGALARAALKPAASQKRLYPPLVTGALVAANVGVYVASAAGWLDTSEWRTSLSALAAAWREDGAPGLLAEQLLALRAAFSHVGVGHLGANMAMLAVLGGVVEASWGHARVAAAYLGAAAAATAVWVAANWGGFAASQGASSAVMGIAGVFLALVMTDFARREPKSLRGAFLLHGLYGLVAGVGAQAVLDVWGVVVQWSHVLGAPLGELGRVNHLSHLAGFLTGLLVFRFLRARTGEKESPAARAAGL